MERKTNKHNHLAELLQSIILSTVEHTVTRSNTTPFQRSIFTSSLADKKPGLISILQRFSTFPNLVPKLCAG